MGPIRQLFSQSPDLKKTESSKKLDKINDKEKSVSGAGTVDKGSKDQVQISVEGRNLLSIKTEASGYLKDVQESEILTHQDIDAIKEKIASKYYFDAEVIDELVDKLVSLPEYMK